MGAPWQVEPDGLVFNPEILKATRIAEGADYEGIRIKFQTSLGRARVTQQLDIGFGDVVVPAPQPIEYPTIFDLPAPKLRGYSKETIVAEKLESLVALGVLNSRMKDYLDIWALSRQFDFEGLTLSNAIAKTLSNRGTTIVPDPIGLTSVFADDQTKKAQWRGFVRKSRLDASAELSEVVVVLSSFLGPVGEALRSHELFRRKWIAPGPWTDK